MPFSFGGCCWPCCCVTAGGAGVATGRAAEGGPWGGTGPLSLGCTGVSAAPFWLVARACPLLWTTAHTSTLSNSGDKFLTDLAGDLLGVWYSGDFGGGGLGGDFFGGDLTGDFLRLGDLRSFSSSSFCSLLCGMVARSFLKIIWTPPS